MKCGNDCLHSGHELCIHKVPIFSELDKESLKKIAALIIHKEYKKGERLLSEGEKTQAITIINEGSVKAYKYTFDGREQILYVFSEGDFFGEHYLLTDQTASYNVEALEHTKVCLLSKDQFQKLLYAYPDISIKIITELDKRISRMENAFQSMGIRNVDSRIASMLLEYADKYGAIIPDGIRIHLPLSREGLANYMGIARETMSRKLTQFEDQGIIRSVNNKTIIITDLSSLEEIAGFSE